MAKSRHSGENEYGVVWRKGTGVGRHCERYRNGRPCYREPKIVHGPASACLGSRYRPERSFGLSSEDPNEDKAAYNK